MNMTARLGQNPFPSAKKELREFPRTATSRGVQVAPRIPLRSCEITALHPDGSIQTIQDKVLATPLFENAFSAFGRGTVISTPDGSIAVEDLYPGDLVNTSTGEAAKLMWIGSSTYVPADASRRAPLVRMMADTFGQGRPSSFLTLGPSARILQTPHHLRSTAGEKRLLTSARTFIDGVNVIDVVPPTPVKLYHFCLDRHAAVRAGGVEVETFHPGAHALRNLTPVMRDRFIGLFPHINSVHDFGPLAHPRAPEAEDQAQVG
ncbi:MAG: Hint domain-containing protein [Pseudomonadota bacterium]